MTKTLRMMTALALALAGCAKETGTAPIDAPVAPVVAATSNVPLPPPDAPRDTLARFPAGPGVALMSDQFMALVRERRVTDHNIPYEERVAIAERALGKGVPASEPGSEGVSWIGLGGRSLVAPFSCMELVLSRKGAPWTMRSTDHRRCGLPYVNDPSKPYTGLATRRTVTRLEEVLGEVGASAPGTAEAEARAKLGTADGHENGETVWVGVGPRGKDAPITCHALRLGGRPRIDEVPLADCSLSWPMPFMSFDRIPEEPVLNKEAKLAECAQRCASNEVCMIDQRVPFTASVRVEPDGSHARYPDGRPAKAELVASCVAIPATCSTVNSSCFFPATSPSSPGPIAPTTVAGPCPKDTYGGRAFFSTPTNHIMCFSRIGGPRASYVPPPPPAPSSVPQTRASSTASPLSQGVF